MSIHLHPRVGAFVAVAAISCAVLPVGQALGVGGVGPADAVNDTAIVLQDTTLDVAAPGVLANDQILAGEPGAASYEVCLADPGFEGDIRALPPRVISQPGKGTLTLSGNGSYRFVPAAGFVGTAVFGYSLANVDELPQCPIRPNMNATLSIEVVATATGSFDGTFTPITAQTGPCILVNTTTIGFGDVPSGSTTWAAPTGGQTTTLSSCSPIDQFIAGTASAALGLRVNPAGAVSLDPTSNSAPSVDQFSYGLAATGVAATRPAAPDQVLTTVPASVTTLEGGGGTATIQHYLIGPAAGTLATGTGLSFAVTFVAVVRS